MQNLGGKAESVLQFLQGTGHLFEEGWLWSKGQHGKYYVCTHNLTYQDGSESGGESGRGNNEVSLAGMNVYIICGFCLMCK